MSKVSPHSGGVGLRINGLWKNYGKKQVLQEINLEVEPGEVFVIMGPSGSGKTVLLKHMIGLESPSQGQVILNGEAITNPEVASKYRMAMVFQSSALLNSLTVAENVGLYLTEHRLKPPAEVQRAVAEKLELVGLKGQEDLFPSELSGGMKKRAAIARALIIEPQLLLFDEPTSELDPLSSLTIAREIARLNRTLGVTAVVVTHDRELAFGIAHRIAMIHAGRILAIGSPAAIRENPDPHVQEFLSADFNIEV